jgi:uncharacterized protein (TIGR03437 family)
MRFFILLAIFAATAYSADFTTYIGSTSPTQSTQSIAISAIASDSAGNTYVTGSNVFVTKLDPAGNIVFSASIGPAGSFGNSIAVDATGNIWVGGQTIANNFPLVNALQTSGSFSGTGFLVKMAQNGTVVYSSYFGGVLGNSGVNGVATDQSGNVYVTGFTDASDFPTTAGLPASPVAGGSAPVYGVFAAKLDSVGQKILYSTVIAGPPNCAFCMPVSITMGIGIAVDGSGEAFVSGDTSTSDLPVTAGGIVAPGAFAFKINADGHALSYFTYLGSGASVGNVSLPDTAAASPIAADSSGNAYIVAYYTGIQGFVTKLSPDGATAWVTSLSALNPSTPNAISLDNSDNAWVTGANPGGDFVAELSADGSSLPYSQEFPAGLAGQDIVVDPSGVVHFAGSIGFISTLTPTEPPAPRALSIVNAASGQLSGTIAPGEVISIYGLEMGPTIPATATPENGFFPRSLGGVQVLVNGNAIPLLYVSASQINAEIPSGVTSGGLTNGIAQVQVVYNSGPLPNFNLALVGSQFAVFQNEGSMAVINQDGTLNKIANPAKPGTVVSIWATGFGATGAPVTGAVATAPNNYCSSCQLSLHYLSTPVTETVEYAGSSVGLIDGLMQINFLIPAQWNHDGAWVDFTPPGYLEPIQLGWVDISQ